MDKNCEFSGVKVFVLQENTIKGLDVYKINVVREKILTFWLSQLASKHPTVCDESYPLHDICLDSQE